jgi:hypothetical protein
MEVFKSILLCQKHYNQQRFDDAKALLAIAKKAVLKAEKNVHPILLGRIAAWETILNSKQDGPPLYFNTISDSFEKICYFIFYYRLKETYNKNTFQEGITESIDLLKLPTKLGAFDKKLLNKFYLTSALYYHHIAAFEKAKTAFLNVDERRLDEWELDWFYKHFKMLKEIYN